MNVFVEADEPAVLATAASRLESLLAGALTVRGRADICLTGGHDAGRLYQLLATGHQHAPRLDWSKVHAFWGDERNVPPDDPDSNYGMAARALLDHVPIPNDQVHRIETDGGDPEPPARQYDAMLRRVRATRGRPRPLFDIMLLGLGRDAHIASIFPGSALAISAAADAPSSALAAAVPAGENRTSRVSLTPRALLDADRVVVIVSGAEKAAAVDAALRQPLDIARWPAQILRAAGNRLDWIMDSAAAGRAPGASRAK